MAGVAIEFFFKNLAISKPSTTRRQISTHEGEREKEKKQEREKKGRGGGLKPVLFINKNVTT